MKPLVGIIGFRGMVGSVLLERMRAESDFDSIEPRFFSTSQAGARAPDIGRELPSVEDAHDLSKLSATEVLISCQGGEYTQQVHPRLRAAGWRGYFIDAASALRMSQDAAIILDPVNRDVIDAALDRGCLDFIGGNCTVSLMLLATHGLIRADLVEWVSAMTYQAASGAGARQMRELVSQMRALSQAASPLLDDPDSSALALDACLQAAIRSPDLPTTAIGAPLAGSLIPWIDIPMPGGQTREEWKATAEANKILGRERQLPIDGVCVRVGVMRCHSQALTIKLREDIPIDRVTEIIAASSPWVSVVENDPESTRAALSPAAVSGTLRVAVGRLRKLGMGPSYLGCFTVGDQLLWGAAEPLRRMLRILVDDRLARTGRLSQTG